MKKSRRQFILDTAKALGLCSLTIATISSCEEYLVKSTPSTGVVEEVDISKEPQLQKIGYGILKSVKKANYGVPVIIMRLPEDEFVCFSSLCTHDHCFGPDLTLPKGNFPGFKEIICQCHGSRFDPYNHAKITMGPAEKPLKEFKTEFNKELSILKIFF